MKRERRSSDSAIQGMVSMKALRTLVLVGLCILGLLWPGDAQEILARSTITVRVRIPAIYSMEVDTEEIVFTQADILNAQTVDGKIIVEKLQASTITLVANIVYSIGISAGTANFAGPDGSIPVSRLQWRIPGGEWVPLDASYRLLLEEGTGMESLTLDFRLVLEPTDPPGDYVGEIVYTLMRWSESEG